MVVDEDAAVHATLLWPALPLCEADRVVDCLAGSQALSPLVFDVLGKSVCVQFGETPREPPQSICTVWFELQGATGQLIVDGRWLDAICGQAGLARHKAQDWSEVASPVRVFLLSWLLAGLLDRLEALVGDRPQLQATAPHKDSDENQCRIVLDRSAGSEPPAIRIWLDLPEAAMRSLPRDPMNRKDGFWQQLPIMASLQAGCQTLCVRQFASLRVGDVVLLSRPLDGLRLALSATLLADVREQEQKYVVTNPWYIDERKEVSMDNINPQDDAVQPDMLEHLTVQLICEVGRISMSLMALKSLKAGSVLPMARRAEQAVDLLVNGMKVGQGELVRLDDALGVRVIRLADTHG